MKDHLKMETHPVACKENVIQGERYPIGIFNLILPILHLILDMAGGAMEIQPGRRTRDGGLSSSASSDDSLFAYYELSGFAQKEILFALVNKYQNRLNILVGELQAMELDDPLFKNKVMLFYFFAFSSLTSKALKTI